MTSPNLIDGASRTMAKAKRWKRQAKDEKAAEPAKEPERRVDKAAERRKKLYSNPRSR